MERKFALRKMARADGRPQWKLAIAAGVHEQQLNRWLNGRGRPGIDNLGHLADALGCSTDEILGRPAPVRGLADFETSDLVAELGRRAA